MTTNANPTTNEFLSRRQVAEFFHVSTATVRRWEQAGTLRAVWLGPLSPRYKRSDIDEFVATHGVRRIRVAHRPTATPTSEAVQ